MRAVATVDTYPRHLGQVIGLAGCHDVPWAALIRLSLPVGVSVLTVCSAKLLYPYRSNTVEEIDGRYDTPSRKVKKFLKSVKSRLSISLNCMKGLSSSAIHIARIHEHKTLFLSYIEFSHRRPRGIEKESIGSLPV